MRFEPRSAQRRETTCYSSICPLPLNSLISQLKLKSVGGRDEYSYDGGYWADIWRCTPPTMSCATGKGRIGVGGGDHVTRSSWPRRLSNFLFLRHGKYGTPNSNLDCDREWRGHQAGRIRYISWAGLVFVIGPNASPEISANRTNFVNVVKGLGEYLTADEEDLRRKGLYR